MRESVGECGKRAKSKVTHYSTLQTVTSALEAHTTCYCMLTTSPTLYSPTITQAHNSIYVHIYMQWNSPLIQYTSKNKYTHIVFMEAIYGAYIIQLQRVPPYVNHIKGVLGFKVLTVNILLVSR